MELREINTFLHVAKLRSFSKAAVQLGYTQAAVTIQIHNLEHELGVHLFDRIGKQTTLTHQGSVFYEYATSVMRELAQARDTLANPQELTGHLCIGTIESVCAGILPKLLRTYHKLHPKVTVRIIIDSPGAILEKMNNNLVDIAYFLDRQVYDTKWEKVLEQPEKVCFVASSRHPLASRQELELDEIIGLPFISTERDASYRYLLEQYLAARGKEIRPFLEIGNTEFIINQLRHNLGISLLPEFTIQKDLEQGILTALQVKDFQLKVWRQILYHRDKWVSREMSSFLELAVKDGNSMEN
ncbi:MAG: LysR family transcriptional regulator [Lachnospiraceae bacterium]|nr:LysR family transcriptional regulator [Lachnospiraceae bacterium]